MESGNDGSRENQRQTIPDPAIKVGHILWIAAVLLGVYALWFGIRTDTEPAVDPAAWGPFGDFLGGILNPLIALAALTWLATSVRVQRSELAALQASAKREQFETTFFSLLDQHNKALDSVRENLLVQAEEVFNPRADVGTMEIYAVRFERQRVLTGHYFRLLYLLLKHIATRYPTRQGKPFSAKFLLEPVTPDEKSFANIVRSLIDTYLLQLIAVNCFAKDESSAYWLYKALVIRYEFFEHLPENGPKNLFDFSLAHYGERAFGKSAFLRDKKARESIASKCQADSLLA